VESLEDKRVGEVLIERLSDDSDELSGRQSG